MCYLQKTHFKHNYINKLKVKRQRDSPHKHKSEESWSRYINIRPSRVQTTKFRKKRNII